MQVKTATKILIVDDKPAMTSLYRRNLESVGGYEVFTENHGSLAIEAARRCRPDLILLDILMPDMLGSEVSAKLREDPALAHIKVVFVTSMLKDHEVEKANESIGGQRIVAKPISAKDLVAVIERELAGL